TQPTRSAALQKQGALGTSSFRQGPSLGTQVSQRDDGSSFRPGIHTVNGQEGGMRLTPGGYLTVAGVGFGDTVGKLALLTTVSQKKLDMQIVDWRDTEVYALFPAGLRGMQDERARVQLITQAGKIYLLEDAQFYATRQELLVQNSLTQVFRVDPGQ